MSTAELEAIEHRCSSCGQFAGVGHVCPTRACVSAAASTMYGSGAWSRGGGREAGSESATREEVEDVLVRTSHTASAMLDRGELTPQEHSAVQEHLAGGWDSLRSGGAALRRSEVQTLGRLSDERGGVSPAERVEAAQDDLRKASVEVGVATLRNARGSGTKEDLVSAREKRAEAKRELSRAQAIAATVDGQSAGPSEPGRCVGCGQFTSDDHQCPVPEGMPSGDYSGLSPQERTEQLLADVQTSVAAIVESGQVERWMDAMSSNGLNRWSMNNRMLALTQLQARGHQDLSQAHLMGFRQWQAHDRNVNRGENAIWILAPIKRTFYRPNPVTGKDEKVSVVTGFKSVPVFDVSQTRGKPLPKPPLAPSTGEATPGTMEGLKERVAAAGYEYRETEIPGCNPSTGEGTQGYTSGETKEIVIDSRLSSGHKASVLAHELGHVHCGHVDEGFEEYKTHRGRMETEAEMTAYMVNRARGMSRKDVDAFSSGYIAIWSKGDPAVISGAMDRAVRAFNKIMDGNWPKTGK